MVAAIQARIRVGGQVQGVGFRPFVYRLAQELGLAGWVRNDAAGVEIAVEGARPQVLRLIERLQHDPPPLARVDRVSHRLGEAEGAFSGFRIEASVSHGERAGIAPDRALCADCLAELFDPSNRRYRHPFINCVNCGPRYTLTTRQPYDRAHTSMAQFQECPACRREYHDSGSRRFHAQANACPECGPRLALFDAGWQPVAGDPLAAAAERIRAGELVAVKGVGGFHLACDARNARAVARLRAAKLRQEKPFAVMVLNARAAARYAMLSPDEAALLESGERPIVLLRKTGGCDAELPGIAPGLPAIGLMLPYAPLHYLLFHELLGCPQGTHWLEQDAPLALVLTSANPGGEPLARDDAEARASLAGLADAFLTHDRDILQRCDDSVAHWRGNAPALVRRARGHALRRIALPLSGPPVLACGAGLKNTVCVTRGDEAFVSQHIGDLEHPGTRRVLEETAASLCDMLGIAPHAIAHDLHPDFYSTRFAQECAAERALPALAVQHHQAHIAAVCAEHGVSEPVLGLALDGGGLGCDGAHWGGELLRVHGAGCARLGHLAPLPMPGGDRAAREPWRMAAAVLWGMRHAGEIAKRFPRQPGAAVADMLARGVHCPPTTSLGRCFDAAAALLGVCEVQGFEGQAAMRLEGLAQGHGPVDALEGGYVLDDDGVLDFFPLLEALAACREPDYGAALFHATVAHGLAAWTVYAAEESGVECIALAGGCLLNRILSDSLSTELEAQGLRVLVARELPPNDGAIALGQAAVALHRLAGGG